MLDRLAWLGGARGDVGGDVEAVGDVGHGVAVLLHPGLVFHQLFLATGGTHCGLEVLCFVCLLALAHTRAHTHTHTHTHTMY